MIGNECFWVGFCSKALHACLAHDSQRVPDMVGTGMHSQLPRAVRAFDHGCQSNLDFYMHAPYSATLQGPRS
jgi:hypothetical protein